MRFWPYVAAFSSVLALFLLYKITTKDSFSRLYEGADGRSSTSKFQFFLWTVVVILTYAALYTVKLEQHRFDPITEIPQNLLIAIGMSVISASAAKAITVSYINTGRISKTTVPAGKGSFGDIFKDDSGVPDLSKLQMIAWTFISIATYLIVVGQHIAKADPTIPDIDSSLMALMGLGQAAYLGKKAVNTSTGAGTTSTATGTTTESGATVKSPDAASGGTM
jgi:hypothetical protein